MSTQPLGAPAAEASSVGWVPAASAGTTWLWRTHRAVAASIVDAEVGPTVPAAVASEASAWVEQQVTALAPHIRLGVHAVGILVAGHALAVGRRPLWRLPDPERRQLLERWRRSRLVPVTQYLRLQRSLVLYAVYEHPHGLATRGR